MSKVWCGYYDGNEKSKRAQEKLGFKYQFTVENSDVVLLNEKRTEHISCITKEGWASGDSRMTRSNIKKENKMRKAMLEIKHYSKSYNGKSKAADDVSLTVESGDIYGFIGHNGAGKSTTIRAVVGVLDFEEGEIFIDGHSVKDEPIECKKITAYIPDNPDLYEN